MQDRTPDGKKSHWLEGYRPSEASQKTLTDHSEAPWGGFGRVPDIYSSG